MSFTSEDFAYNLALVDNLVDDQFSHVEKADDLKDQFIQFINQNEISLFEYSGQAHRNMLLNAIKKSIENNKFNAEKAKLALEQFKTELSQFSVQQAPEAPSIQQQLRDKGYVDPHHLLTDEDIRQVINHFLGDSAIDPIGVANDIEAIKQALRMNHVSPLYIPANLNHNHYVLFIMTHNEKNEVSFKCWDPMRGNEETIKEAPLADIAFNLTTAVTDVYGPQVNITYEFGNEQNDGFSCGYRVVQKALKEQKIENDFTRVDVNNPDQLYVEFIKLVASLDENLKEIVDDLNVVAEDNALTVYRDDAGYEKRGEVKDVINNKKLIQEQADKFLAIALQDVYFSNPDIDGPTAMKEAQKKLLNSKMSELQNREQELILELKEQEKTFKPNNPDIVETKKEIESNQKDSIAQSMPFFNTKNATAQVTQQAASNCGSESEDANAHKHINDTNNMAMA